MEKSLYLSFSIFTHSHGDLMFYYLKYMFMILIYLDTLQLEWLISISNSTCATLNSQSPPQPVSPIIILIYVNSSFLPLLRLKSLTHLSPTLWRWEVLMVPTPQACMAMPHPWLLASFPLATLVSAAPEHPRLSPVQDFGSNGYLCFQYKPSK